MKIYLATPVNGRKEKTLAAKLTAALRRVQEMKHYLEKRVDGAEYYSSMDMWNDLATMTEAQIMGECTRMVMESDLVVLDDGWECSRGCTVERYIALQYDVPVRTLARLKLDDVLTGVCKLAERSAV